MMDGLSEKKVTTVKAGDGERKSLLDTRNSQLPDTGITIFGGILVPGPDKGDLWFEWALNNATMLASRSDWRIGRLAHAWKNAYPIAPFESSPTR